MAKPRLHTGDPRQLVVAAWHRRAGAAVLDALLVVAIAAPAWAGVVLATDHELLDQGLGPIAARAGSLFALWVALFAAYAAALMARTDGQTLGKMATRIRVVRTSGDPMTLGWAAWREGVIRGLLIYIVGGLFTAAFLIDWVLPIWEVEGRSLHDLLSETWVVEA